MIPSSFAAQFNDDYSDDISEMEMPDATPSSPASPKLGNFNRVFDFLTHRPPSPPLVLLEKGDHVFQKTHIIQTTYLPRAITPRPFATGFLGGLDLTSILSTSEAAEAKASNSSDDDTEEVEPALASSLPETNSTAASSPPSDSNDFVKKHMHDRGNVTPQQNRSIRIPILSNSNRVKSAFSLPEGTTTPAVIRTQIYHESTNSPGFQPFIIVPKYTCSKNDKLRLLQAKLAPQYDLDSMYASEPTVPSSHPIHVFVDLSNIVIGFYNSLKISNGIPIDQYVKVPPFFFEGFATVLERGRPVGGRKLAGSVVDNTDRSRWPDYMHEAEAAGYEMNILNRVEKMALTPKPSSRKGYRLGSGKEYPSDAYSSDDAAPARQKKTGEQGVDELLHMKMCQCVLDFAPGTMVLATGDAAAAEFSDGFLVNVERALKNGWRVELVSWSKGIAFAWRNLERNREWAGRFRIIELDYLVDELVGSHLA